MKKIIILLFLLLPIHYLSAETLNYDGCAALSAVDTDITIRMQDMRATITIADAGQKTYNFTVNNLDPDFVIIDNYNIGTLIRSASSLTFQTTVNNDAEINITPWYEPTDDFYFAAMSDNQSISGASSAFTEFTNDINIINPYFSLNAGDLVSGDGDGSSYDGELEPMFIDFSTAAANFKQPHFTVPGNHDHGDNGYTMYEKYFGDYNSSFDFANTHFSLTSSVNDSASAQGYMMDDNYNWLSNDLTATNLQKVVMFHHPVNLPSWAHSGFSDNANRDSVISMLEQNEINTLIVGHSHGYDYSQVDNNFYQLITAGAGADLTQEDGYYHFTLMHTQGDTITPQAVKKNEFYLVKEELNNNDGTEDSVTTRVYNDGDTDWPWLRMKFKLNKDIEHFYIYDAAGNYYADYQEQILDDYRVVYLETSMPAYGYNDFTVAKSTKIHQGVINTIYSSGEVSYSQMPLNNLTETNLEAVPSIDAINLETTNWTDEIKSWHVNLNSNEQSINYYLDSLNFGYRYQFFVDGKFYGYFTPNETNELSFTYSGDGTSVNFDLIRENIWAANNILLMPASGGGPQVRIFNGDGNFQSQFYAYESIVQGGYQAKWVDVTGDRYGEIAVVPEAGLNKKLKLFDTDGNLLAQHKIFNDYHGGYNLAIADINGDLMDEIIIAAKTEKNKIKIFKYKNNKLKLITIKTIYQDFTGGIKVAVGDLNNDDIIELVCTPYSGQAELKIYKLNNGKLKKIASQENYGTRLALGDINKDLKKEILVASDNKLRIFKLKNNNALKLLKKKTIASYDKIFSNDINHDYKDEIIFLDDTKIDLYQYKSKKINLLQEINPYGAGYGSGLNVNLLDLDGDWNWELIVAPQSSGSKIKIYSYQEEKLKAEKSFYGFAEDFTGGVNL